MNQSSITFASKTDKGRRSANEDSCLALTSEELGGQADGLFIVANGMGGRASGALAGRIAVNTVRDAFISKTDEAEDLSDVLGESLRAANDAVYREQTSKPELRGMGSTCVAVAVRDDRAFFAHMGDSRIYLLRAGELRRLTEDHSFVAEKVRCGEITEEDARHSRFRNVITRAIGIEPNAQPAVGSTDLEPGDVILLCSDGLTGPVPDARIADILCGSSEPEDACNRLVNAALKSGGSDNVTVVVAAYGAPQRVLRDSQPIVRTWQSPWILAGLLGLVLGIALGVYPGHLILRRYAKPPVEQKTHLDLARVTYTDPVQLTYIPLQPGFLALDPKGFLHVVDLEGRRMKVDTSGQVVTTYPARDTFKPRNLSAYQSAAADIEGNLYVSDPVGMKILKFGANGLLIGTIGEGKLISPSALAVDAKGSIFVIDGGRLKVIRS
ncbi:MAG: Stp1/IreP family PP2C-type Ser/Thr phosphatase, partial [Armatimonadetes bacterium]|nr:Stp1/IreP family PP2C-type Ser/Thr phosphatase [Armatimonadota bacterium]